MQPNNIHNRGKFWLALAGRWCTRMNVKRFPRTHVPKYLYVFIVRLFLFPFSYNRFDWSNLFIYWVSFELTFSSIMIVALINFKWGDQKGRLKFFNIEIRNVVQLIRSIEFRWHDFYICGATRAFMWQRQVLPFSNERFLQRKNVAIDRSHGPAQIFSA